jgi:hypothetical protein
MHVAPHTDVAGGAQKGAAAAAPSSTQSPAAVTFHEDALGKAAVAHFAGEGLQ